MRCWGEANFEERRFTTMPANARVCPCDKLQFTQPGFNNLRAKRAHKTLHKVPWSQRASLIVQRRGKPSAWREKLSLTPATFTGPTAIQRVRVSCSVDQISWDRAPTTTRQLHHHNGPVCKCEKLMSHHKNFASPSWNLEQYLFSCSQRAAPHTTLGQSASKRGGTALQLEWNVEVWVLHFFFKIKCQ